MGILKGDKIILTKEFENFRTIGEIFEIANVIEDLFVIRTVKDKVAVGTIKISEFEKYFKKEDYFGKWTKWCPIIFGNGAYIGEYKTNRKKVFVRIKTPDNTYVQSSSTCCKTDEFDLVFGINLAYRRCEKKILTDEVKKHSAKLTESNNKLNDVNKIIENMYKYSNKFKKE